MTLGQNGVLRYDHFGEFLEFFWDRMAAKLDFGLKFFWRPKSKIGHN